MTDCLLQESSPNLLVEEYAVHSARWYTIFQPDKQLASRAAVEHLGLEGVSPLSFPFGKKFPF